MTNLNQTVITNLENILNSNSNSCTIYKQQFKELKSVGINLGIFEGQYIFVKNNTPKVSIFYNVSYNDLKLCFFKYTSDNNGIFSKVYDLPLFNTEKLQEIISLVFENIQFN